MNNLMLYLNFENRVYEYHLPALDNRRIQVNLGSLGVGVECMLNLEVWDGRWYAKPSPQLALRERDKEFGLYELRAERVLYPWPVRDDASNNSSRIQISERGLYLYVSLLYWLLWLERLAGQCNQQE